MVDLSQWSMLSFVNLVHSTPKLLKRFCNSPSKMKENPSQVPGVQTVLPRGVTGVYMNFKKFKKPKPGSLPSYHSLL